MSILIPYDRLSPEQQKVIRDISREDNDRSLFVQGPPGSGKTLISLYTLRNIIRERNIRLHLIMFNHSLYGFLSSALKVLGIEDSVTIETKDKYFFGLHSRESKNRYFDEENYSIKYGKILEDLQDIDFEKTIDVLLIDEVQDLNVEEWNVLKKQSSIIISLGDFDQKVYDSSLSLDDVLVISREERLSKVFRFHKNIAKLAAPFSTSKENLENMVENDSTIIPQIIEVESNKKVYDEIAEIINNIQSFEKGIAIITPQRSNLNILSEELNFRGIDHHFYTSNQSLRNHDYSSKKPLLLTSFSAKGLEFEHVILFGFEESEYMQKMRRDGSLNTNIYVSLTRTNAHLYIINTANTIPELRNLEVEESNMEEISSLDDLF